MRKSLSLSLSQQQQQLPILRRLLLLVLLLGGQKLNCCHGGIVPTSIRGGGSAAAANETTTKSTNQQQEEDVDNVNCTSIQAEIDSLPSTDAIVEYLQYEVRNVNNYTNLFGCLGGPIQRMPTDMIPPESDLDYIYGDGWVAHYSKRNNNNKNGLLLPFDIDYIFDRFQSWFIQLWWQGKIFKNHPPMTV